jgi:novel protein kinase C eta type
MDHSNIIKCFHYTETPERFCLYMEYAGYGSDYLTKKIYVKNTQIKEDKLFVWAQDILSALIYLHEKGVIHTDIKLSNILIQKQDSKDPEEDEEESIPMAKLIDFGLCHVLEQGQKTTLMETLVGTKDYQAPEMRAGAHISTAVDLWAFGIVLYEMAVGYHPNKIQHLELPKLNDRVPYFKKHWVNRDPLLLDLIK